MTRYALVPEQSRVAVVVASTLHPVKGSGVGLEGYIDAHVVDGAIDLSVAPAGELTFRLAQLRSDNRLFDSEMQRRIDTRRFPVARGSLSRVAEIGRDQYRLKGELTFHGVTRSVDGEAEVRLRGDVLEATGQLTIDIRDFELAPPKLFLLKVDPVVVISLAVVARHIEGERG